jgi:hypothetical protein
MVKMFSTEVTLLVQWYSVHEAENSWKLHPLNPLRIASLKTQIRIFIVFCETTFISYA